MQKVLRYWPVVGIYMLSIVFAVFWMTTVKHASLFHFVEGFMASFLILFACVKLWDLHGFAKRFSTYDIIAKKLPAYGYMYPFIEFGLGAFMILGSSVVADYTMAVLAVIGIISVYISIIKKERLYCACLGTAFNVPLSYVTIIENITMLVSALTMIILGHSNSLLGSYLMMYRQFKLQILIL